MAALKHLKGLTNLQSLNFGATKVTDGGLKHLRGLTKLQSLGVKNHTEVTDAGLEHLRGLTGPPVTELDVVYQADRFRIGAPQSPKKTPNAGAVEHQRDRCRRKETPAGITEL